MATTTRINVPVGHQVTNHGSSNTMIPITGDKKFPQESQIYIDGQLKYEPALSIRNGYYQHIFWLGVGGYAIVNYYDKEIVLVDPWPSYCSLWVGRVPTAGARPLDSNRFDAIKRLQDLANFLRNSKTLGYKVTAICVSHMHFDHADDVPLLLQLLWFDSGKVTTPHTHLTFQLEGTQFELDELPVICADFDTIFYYKTFYFGVHWKDLVTEDYFKGNSKQKDDLDDLGNNPTPNVHSQVAQYCISAGFHEILTEVSGDRIYYDDSYNLYNLSSNERAVPGTPARRIELANSEFIIQPYVWDHMNTFFRMVHWQKALDDQKSGKMQRISAFMIWRKDEGKKTFIIGSAGEMNENHTNPKPSAELIETDVLLQSVQRDDYQLKWYQEPFDGPLEKIVKESREYTLKNIAVKDYLVLSHWEEFIFNVSKDDIYKTDFRQSVTDNIEGYKTIIKNEPAIPLSNIDLVKDNRIFVLKRMGTDFEREYPKDVAELHEDIKKIVSI